jgi:methylmalonyl-CoA mutase C-terminal domain/subunit
MSEKKARVLVAKPGLDGHDRGAKTVVHALREAGFEVIYTGLHRTVDEIVKTALEEDVDVIGLSILSGAHIPICTEMRARMAEAGIAEVPLMVGGVIPERDVPKLKELGVEGIFPTSSPYEDIIAFVKDRANG